MVNTVDNSVLSGSLLIKTEGLGGELYFTAPPNAPSVNFYYKDPTGAIYNIGNNLTAITIAGNIVNQTGLNIYAINQIPPDWAETNPNSLAYIANKPPIPSPYTLPPATATVLGGIKVGSGLSVTADGLLSVNQSAQIPVATATVLGGVTIPVASSVSVTGLGAIDVKVVTASTNAINKDGTGALFALQATSTQAGVVQIGSGINTTTSASGATIISVPSTPSYTLPVATATSLGGIKATNRPSTTSFVTGVNSTTGDLQFQEVNTTSYTLPPTTSNSLGGVIAGNNPSGSNSFIRGFDASGTAQYANVAFPTTSSFSAGRGISLSSASSGVITISTPAVLGITAAAPLTVTGTNDAISMGLSTDVTLYVVGGRLGTNLAYVPAVFPSPSVPRATSVYHASNNSTVINTAYGGGGSAGTLTLSSNLRVNYLDGTYFQLPTSLSNISVPAGAGLTEFYNAIATAMNAALVGYGVSIAFNISATTPSLPISVVATFVTPTLKSSIVYSVSFDRWSCAFTAPAWVAGSYVVGNWVVYNNTLYYCNAATSATPPNTGWSAILPLVDNLSLSASGLSYAVIYRVDITLAVTNFVDYILSPTLGRLGVVNNLVSSDGSVQITQSPSGWNIRTAGGGTTITLTTTGNSNAATLTGNTLNIPQYISTTNNSIFVGSPISGISDSNTVVGVNALDSNVSSIYNTAVGFNVLTFNTTGSYNTGVGLNGLFRNTTGGSNTAIGIQSLLDNVTGNYNVGIGVNAGISSQLTSLGLTNASNGYVIINGGNGAGTAGRLAFYSGADGGVLLNGLTSRSLSGSDLEVDGDIVFNPTVSDTASTLSRNNSAVMRVNSTRTVASLDIRDGAGATSTITLGGGSSTAGVVLTSPANYGGDIDIANTGGAVSIGARNSIDSIVIDSSGAEWTAQYVTGFVGQVIFKGVVSGGNNRSTFAFVTATTSSSEYALYLSQSQSGAASTSYKFTNQAIFGNNVLAVGAYVDINGILWVAGLAVGGNLVIARLNIAIDASGVPTVSFTTSLNVAVYGQSGTSAGKIVGFSAEPNGVSTTDYRVALVVSTSIANDQNYFGVFTMTVSPTNITFIFSSSAWQSNGTDTIFDVIRTADGLNLLLTFRGILQWTSASSIKVLASQTTTPQQQPSKFGTVLYVNNATAEIIGTFDAGEILVYDVVKSAVNTYSLPSNFVLDTGWDFGGATPIGNTIAVLVHGYFVPNSVIINYYLVLTRGETVVTVNDTLNINETLQLQGVDVTQYAVLMGMLNAAGQVVPAWVTMQEQVIVYRKSSTPTPLVTGNNLNYPFSSAGTIASNTGANLIQINADGSIINISGFRIKVDISANVIFSAGANALTEADIWVVDASGNRLSQDYVLGANTNVLLSLREFVVLNAGQSFTIKVYATTSSGGVDLGYSYVGQSNPSIQFNARRILL